MSATLLLEALRLKELHRAGWIRAGVTHPESVAAHSWGVAWLALLLCPEDLDQHRVLMLALIHDLPEVHVGDITPHDGIDRAEKHRREHLAATSMLSEHPVLLDAWQEYTDNQTPEAKFVHQLDKLDMGLQAIHYRQERDLDTDEFVVSARKKLTKQLQQLLDSISEDVG